MITLSEKKRGYQMSTTLIIILIIVAIVLVYAAIYNGIIKYRNWNQEAWSQIDVQLKRRNDLIPNLIETVKGYAKHEQETLSKIVQMRNQLVDNTSATNDPKATMAVSDQLSQSLKSIFALSEAYPDLKANEEFLKLQEELANTENKIAYARQSFNASATQYNNKIQTFPGNIIAGFHGFKPVEYLAIPEAEKQVPKVSF